MEFLTFIGHSDYVGDGVETCLITRLITGLINAGINVVRLQFIMLSDFELEICKQKISDKIGYNLNGRC